MAAITQVRILVTAIFSFFSFWLVYNIIIMSFTHCRPQKVVLKNYFKSYTAMKVNKFIVC